MHRLEEAYDLLCEKINQLDAQLENAATEYERAGIERSADHYYALKTGMQIAVALVRDHDGLGLRFDRANNVAKCHLVSRQGIVDVQDLI